MSKQEKAAQVARIAYRAVAAVIVHRLVTDALHAVLHKAGMQCPCERGKENGE